MEPEGTSRQRSGLLVTGLLLLAVQAYLLWQAAQLRQAQQASPNFADIPAGKARKQAFFDYLRPIIVAENGKRLAMRERLLALKAQDDAIGRRDAAWLAKLAARYELPETLTAPELVDALLLNVDTIPVSLALAQAAKESAWGTSRFAIEGNSYFGQRCWEPGCGMVPRKRQAGHQFEVRRFGSVQEAVSSYLVNINSHPDYAELRKYRARQRAQGEAVSGIELAEKMAQYSERRSVYVDEIQSLIHFNKLDHEL